MLKGGGGDGGAGGGGGGGGGADALARPDMNVGGPWYDGGAGGGGFLTMGGGGTLPQSPKTAPGGGALVLSLSAGRPAGLGTGGGPLGFPPVSMPREAVGDPGASGSYTPLTPPTHLRV